MLTSNVPLIILAEPLGGVGGASLNWKKHPTKAAMDRRLNRSKYVEMSSPEATIVVPMINDKPVPTWFGIECNTSS